jgi:hypothetical protein
MFPVVVGIQRFSVVASVSKCSKPFQEDPQFNSGDSRKRFTSVAVGNDHTPGSCRYDVRIFINKQVKTIFMAKVYNSFIPGKDAAIVVWASNFMTKIATLGLRLGLTQEQIARIQQYAQSLIDAVNKVEQKKREQEQAVLAKEALKADNLTLLRTCIANLKTLNSYTEDMGGELGIIGGSVAVDNDMIKPSVRVKTINGVVKVLFKKRRQPGVNIYSRLKGTNGWEKLGYDVASPFIDNRPLADAAKPEIREYMVICSNGKEETGKPSDIATVVFAG